NKVEKVNNNGSEIFYAYDKNGNIETITENSKVIKYTYNALNELTREDNEVLNKTIVYSYDDGGNILTKTEYPYTTGTPANPTKTYNYTYGDTNWKDKLTAFDGKEITYDAIGNPLTYNGWDYTWEMGRQLSGMSKPGMDVSYKYNSEGIRTEKTVNGSTTKYTIVGGKVTYEKNETTGGDRIYYTYDSSDNLVSMNYCGTEYFYIRNAQGDIIGLANTNGNKVVSYTYDSWGKLISIKDQNGNDITNSTGHIGYKNPYRYRGYRFDNETGMYYLQSRYYSPEFCRMLNADDTDVLDNTLEDLTDKNLFAYCDNNPVNRSDEGGYFWETILDIGSIGWSAYDLISKPSWANAGYLAWDIGATVIPFVPGSYTAKGVKAVSKVDDVVDTAKVVKNTGRTGKQARLREIAKDDKVSSALRGEIKRDINQINRGKRTTIRVPNGYQMAHKRGYEARKGFGYSHSVLNDTNLHKLQHKYDKYGRRR
ncbi:hypothetical protein Q428_14025, partial [Fervidicella metallireducens AeB]